MLPSGRDRSTSSPEILILKLVWSGLPGIRRSLPEVHIRRCCPAPSEIAGKVQRYGSSKSSDKPQPSSEIEEDPVLYNSTQSSKSPFSSAKTLPLEAITSLRTTAAGRKLEATAKDQAPSKQKEARRKVPPERRKKENISGKGETKGRGRADRGANYAFSRLQSKGIPLGAEPLNLDRGVTEALAESKSGCPHQTSILSVPHLGVLLLHASFPGNDILARSLRPLPTLQFAGYFQIIISPAQSLPPLSTPARTRRWLELRQRAACLHTRLPGLGVTNRALNRIWSDQRNSRCAHRCPRRHRLTDRYLSLHKKALGRPVLCDSPKRIARTAGKRKR